MIILIDLLSNDNTSISTDDSNIFNNNNNTNPFNKDTHIFNDNWFIYLLKKFNKNNNS